MNRLPSLLRYHLAALVRVWRALRQQRSNCCDLLYVTQLLACGVTMQASKHVVYTNKSAWSTTCSHDCDAIP